MHIIFSQIAKHITVGAGATLVDLGIFELILSWLAPLPLLANGISFFIATCIKYVGNKYWTFQKHEREKMATEVAIFFFVTSIGLLIDVTIFHFVSQLATPLSDDIWRKISVILAAGVAAIWNFSADKFIVFKK